MSTILVLILWMIMGIATAYLANQRGRDPYIWFALGVVFGILAMLLLFILPPVKSENEWENDLKNEQIGDCQRAQSFKTRPEQRIPVLPSGLHRPEHPAETLLSKSLNIIRCFRQGNRCVFIVDPIAHP